MILICGASGLVGREMSKFLDKMNINYIGTYNSNHLVGKNMIKINFDNIEEIEETIRKYEITVCLFLIVERLTDICEKDWEKTKKVNIDFVHNTSFVCNKLNVNFIHLSTDYVFDGQTGPNFPESPKNPLQNYGISKFISELRVQRNCKDYVIIRTPVLYSSLSNLKDNAVTLIGKNLMDLRESKIFKEDDYCIRRPLYIPDLCSFIHNIITENKNGIYHFFNPYNKFTKYQICKKISSIIGTDHQKILPQKKKINFSAPRPFDTNLQDEKLNVSEFNFSSFDLTLKNCFEKFKQIRLSKDSFFLIDLDGTIIDSNLAHYNSYKKVFEERDIEMVSFEEWNDIISNSNFNSYLERNFNEEEIKEIKNEKLEKLKKEEISFTKGAEKFICHLQNNGINFSIVTNTNKKTIEIFKEKLQLLRKISNWICREDYDKSKPNPEPYKKAISKFLKKEKYIIGVEDSKVGYESLKGVTDKIYIFNNYKIFKEKDCYLIDNLEVFLNTV